MAHRSCPKCGTTLPLDSPAGRCPKCLDSATSRSSDPEAPTIPVLPGHSWSEEATPSEPRLGKVRYIGDYELLAEIARGGMGVVYQARQVTLNRPVALKMILAGEFAGPQEVERFQAEAEAVARLDHPHIVPIYEVGEHEGRHYFSMKLVDGTSLAQQIAEYAADPKRAVEVVAKVARAVHYAHQRGILHRDLKPANILLDRRGEPHVTDFGIAKRVESQAGLTRSGAVMGTPDYMAPEQAGGKSREVTTAADVFSLGAILYHLLTGSPPFRGDTPLETIRKVIDEEPVRPGALKRVDRDLETICLKCLEKEPARRYGSAEALADDLDRWTRREPVLARRSTPPERLAKWVRRKPLVAALTALSMAALVGGVVGIFWQWRKAEAARVAVGQRMVAERRAREGEAAARKSVQLTLARMELQKVNEMLGAAQESKLKGLPMLARSLRRDPENRMAAYRLLSLLLYQNFGWPVQERPMNGYPVLDATFTKNGPLVLTGNGQRQAVLWNFHDPQPIRSAAPASPVQSGFLSPSGKKFIIALTNATAEIFETAGTAEPSRLKLRGNLRGVLFHAEDNLLFTAENPDRLNGTKLTVTGWDLRTGSAVYGPHELDGVTGIIGLALDEENLMVGSYGDGARVRLNLKTGTATRANDGIMIQYGELFPSFPQVAPYYSDGVIYLNQFMGSVIVSLPQGTDYASPRRFASADFFEALEITPAGSWQLRSIRPRQVAPGYITANQEPLAFTHLSRDGAVMAGYSREKNVQVLAAISGEVLLTEKIEGVTWMQLSQEGTRLAVGRNEGTNLLLNVPAKGARIDFSGKPTSTNAAVADTSFNRGATQLAILWTDGMLQNVDTRSGAVAWQKPIVPRPAEGQYLGPLAVWFLDSEYVLARAGNLFKTVRVNDGASAGTITTNEPVSGAWTVAPDGRHFGMASERGVVRIYALPAFTFLAELELSQPIRHLRFAPDGSTLAVVPSNGKDVRLWRWKTGEAMGDLQKINFQPETIDFSPDGERFVLAGSGSWRVFEAATGSPLTEEIQGWAYGSRRSGFSREGNHLIFLNEQGSLWVWELPAIAGPVPAWLPALADALAGQTLPDAGAERSLPFSAMDDARKAAARAAPTEPYAAYARWLFASPEGRTISPMSPITSAAFVSNAVSSSEPSIRYIAEFVSPTNVPLLEALAQESTDRLLAPLVRETARGPVVNRQRASGLAALNMASRVLMLEPASAAGKVLSAQAWEQLEQPSRALAILRQIPASQQNPDYWGVLATCLQSAHEPEPALDAWRQAIARASSDAGPWVDKRNRFAIQLRNRLSDLGRKKEAGEANCERLGIPRRDPAAPTNLVDLSLSYVASLTAARSFQHEGDALTEFPLGVRDFAGTTFDARGMVIAGGTFFSQAPLPAAVGGKCRVLYFLHSVLGGHAHFEGQTVGKYLVYYADGTREVLPVIYGQEVRDWWVGGNDPLPASKASVAWTGSNARSAKSNTQVRLFKMSWPNPKPGTVIDRIEFEKDSFGPVLFTVAVTLGPD